MLEQLFSISVSVSVVILLMLAVRPLLIKSYQAKLRYWIWLFIAVRLLVLYNPAMPYAAIEIPQLSSQHIQFTASDTAIPDRPQVNEGNHGIATEDVGAVLSLNHIILLIWSAGVFLFILYHITGYLLFKKRVKAWSTTIESGNPPIAICKKITSPMLFGILHPKILLPDVSYTKEDHAMIVAHEKVHHRRKDIYYKIILLLCNAVHWFNPVVYLMVKYANKDLEFSCDEIVVENRDQDFKKAYSQSILNAIQIEKASALSTYFKGGKKDMKNRLSNILRSGRKRSGILLIIVSIIAIMLSGALIACSTTGTGDALGYEAMLPLLGNDKQSVMETLRISTENAEVNQDDQQEEYRINTTVNDAACQAMLIFYQDVFIAFRYEFDNIQTAYTYATELRGGMDAEYGEKTTYPGITSDTQAYFDSLTAVTDIQQHIVYYEDWTSQTAKEQMESALGRDFSRIDVRFSMRVLMDNLSQVTVQYIPFS